MCRCAAGVNMHSHNKLILAAAKCVGVLVICVIVFTAFCVVCTVFLY